LSVLGYLISLKDEENICVLEFTLFFRETGYSEIKNCGLTKSYVY